MVDSMIEKRRRCLFSCPSWTRGPSHCPFTTGQTTPVSPRQYIYIHPLTLLANSVSKIAYTYYGTLRCHLSVCEVEVAKFTSHNDKRSKTPFSYMSLPFHPFKGQMSDFAKITVFFRTLKRFNKFMPVFSSTPMP